MLLLQQEERRVRVLEEQGGRIVLGLLLQRERVTGGGVATEDGLLDRRGLGRGGPLLLQEEGGRLVGLGLHQGDRGRAGVDEHLLVDGGLGRRGLDGGGGGLGLGRLRRCLGLLGLGLLQELLLQVGDDQGVGGDLGGGDGGRVGGGDGGRVGGGLGLGGLGGHGRGGAVRREVKGRGKKRREGG